MRKEAWVGVAFAFSVVATEEGGSDVTWMGMVELS
jgi:hypothetical protein